jgi:hypothetical protein
MEICITMSQDLFDWTETKFNEEFVIFITIRINLLIALFCKVIKLVVLIKNMKHFYHYSI